MDWLLILVITAGEASVGTAASVSEFRTEQACEIAGKRVKQLKTVSNQYRQIDYVCAYRGVRIQAPGMGTLNKRPIFNQSGF